MKRGRPLKQSLTSGIPTLRSDFNIGLVSADDICQILRVASKCSIRSLKIGVLQLEFGKVDQLTQDIPIGFRPEPNESQAVKITEEANRKLSVEQLQMDLSELLLSDPLAHEELMSGVLGDAGGRSAEAT